MRDFWLTTDTAGWGILRHARTRHETSGRRPAG